MRRALAPLLLLALLVAPAAADDAPIGVRKPMPKRLDALEARLSALQTKIDGLVAAANRDPAEIKIAMYLNYTPKQMKKTRGRVRAEDLVTFMVDASKDFQTVRMPAFEALKRGARVKGDPELSNSEKQGPRTKRAHFCWKEVAPCLKDDKRGSGRDAVMLDRIARKLAHDLLVEFYPRARNTHPEIRIYNPDGESGNWKSAYNAWVRYLKKQ